MIEETLGQLQADYMREGIDQNEYERFRSNLEGDKQSLLDQIDLIQSNRANFAIKIAGSMA